MIEQGAKPNYYEILQLQPFANPALVIAAYRILSKLYHPDTAREEANLEKFRLLQQAYETLSDPHKRTTYDQELRVTLPDTPQNNFWYGYRPEPEPEEPRWQDRTEDAGKYTPTEEELEFYKNLYDNESTSKRRRTIALILVYVLLMVGAAVFGMIGVLVITSGSRAEQEYVFLYFGIAVVLLLLAQFEAYLS